MRKRLASKAPFPHAPLLTSCADFVFLDLCPSPSALLMNTQELCYCVQCDVCQPGKAGVHLCFRR